MKNRFLRVKWPIVFTAIFLNAAMFTKGEKPLSEGDAAYRAGKFDLAIEKYTESIKRNEKDANLYNSRGLAYKEKQDHARAIADLSKALRLKQEWFFYYNRGVIHDAKGDKNAAIADLTKAIQLSPAKTIGRTDSLIARAHCYFDQRKDEPAIADLNAAIKIGVDEPDPYILRGILHKVQHKYAQSLADYEKAIALAPRSDRAYRVEAYLLAVCPMPKYRDGKKALAYATKACELTDWKHPDALETLAAAYAEVGDFDQAIHWQTKSAGIDPRKADETRLSFYRDKQPFRDLNRKEEPVPNLAKIKEKVVIELGQRLGVEFGLGDNGALEPKTAKATPSGEPNSLTLAFHEEKADRVLYLRHYFDRTLRARCLARLKGYDTYFETDILPIPPHVTTREVWSEPIDELVLFDFKVGPEEDQPERKLSDCVPGESQNAIGNFVLNETG